MHGGCMKKKCISLCFSLSLQAALHNPIDDFKIILESTWQDLEHDGIKSEEFSDSWVLIGSITFRKKAKEVINLERLYLHWTGKPLEHLLGSLYKKTHQHEFLPIEENLICDGKWNNAQQILMLDFDKQQTLGVTNTFYLVLTIPKKLEETVKAGSFDLLDYTLPEPFQACSSSEKLSLAMSKKITPNSIG